VFETFSGKEIEKSWKKSSWAQDTEWAKSEAGFCPQYLRIQAVNLPDHLLIITCRTFRHRLDGPNIPSQVRSTVAVHKFETIFLMPRLFCQIKIYEGREISSKKKRVFEYYSSTSTVSCTLSGVAPISANRQRVSRKK
jgi:hypothetical protein